MQRRHHAFRGHRHHVLAAIPRDWRRASVDRADLDRFLFAPEDIVVVLGQDGLVANVAKYLDGQPLIGLNPDPSATPACSSPTRRPPRPTCCATSPPGGRAAGAHDDRARGSTTGRSCAPQRDLRRPSHPPVRALHARASAGAPSASPRPALIVTTGTGATGWAASIDGRLAAPLPLPSPTERGLAYLVREPWPSRATGVSLAAGRLDGDDVVRITSELPDGGDGFGDGIEADALAIDWGQTLSVGVAPQALQLVR